MITYRLEYLYRGVWLLYTRSFDEESLAEPKANLTALGLEYRTRLVRT